MDKPILFSAPMVRALLEGGKTQTRRILKPQPESHMTLHRQMCDCVIFRNVAHGLRQDVKIRTEPSDRLYVREHWKAGPAYDDLPPRDMSGEEAILYLADGAEERWGWDHLQVYGRHRQAMHMPRWASRLTLTVTDVRVERLQDISEDDAKAEGITLYENRHVAVAPPKGVVGFASGHCTGWSWDEPVTIDDLSDSPAWAFEKLWGRINGPDAWEQNPWVVAYTFTVNRKNIDAE